MKKSLYIVAIFIAVMAVALYAEQPKTTAAAGHQHHMASQSGEHHCAMMGDSKEMAEKMGAMDARLQSLVATMNGAKGDDRIDAMSAVINELVAQRTQMRDQMMSMHGSMAACCMKDGDTQHAAGDMKGMEGCPMHKGSR